MTTTLTRQTLVRTIIRLTDMQPAELTLVAESKTLAEWREYLGARVDSDELTVTDDLARAVADHLGVAL